MKTVKETEDTSTIFFDSNEEIEKFKESLKEKGFIKFDPNKKL